MCTLQVEYSNQYTLFSSHFSWTSEIQGVIILEYSIVGKQVLQCRFYSVEIASDICIMMSLLSLELSKPLAQARQPLLILLYKGLNKLVGRDAFSKVRFNAIHVSIDL